MYQCLAGSVSILENYKKKLNFLYTSRINQDCVENLFMVGVDSGIILMSNIFNLLSSMLLLTSFSFKQIIWLQGIMSKNITQ